MANDGEVQPLLSTIPSGHGLNNNEEKPSGDEIYMITPGDFAREFIVESKKIWSLAGPAIFTSFCQYGLITISQMFAGRLGTTQLAALSVENSIISAFPYGLMFGLSSALETYCGQAFGANQQRMLGIYMQQSWVILNAVALAGVSLFIFANPILKFLGQTPSISSEAGKLALWMIPQQFAYALVLPSTKFLQAQSKVVVIVAAVALCFHAFFSWVFVQNLGLGLVGVALVIDGSWWFIALAQLLYCVSGSCGESWAGFSWRAFENLWGFFKVSIASAVMMSLEVWYIMALTLFAGYLEDAVLAVDAFSICVNIVGWACMMGIGLNVASSVRVSNELGSGHPRKARFSAFVIGVTSLLIGLFFVIVLIMSRRQYPALFTNNSEVKQLVENLAPLLGISLLLTNVQYALNGVAIGAGWQIHIAYMSSGCYFVFGVPLGALMAYMFKMGIQGIWCGMVIGMSLQSCLVLWLICVANWNKEAYAAEERVREYRVKNQDEETV